MSNSFEHEMADFIKGYITCALWSSVDDSDDPLDNNYDKDDIPESSLYLMVIDCYNFYRQNHTLWANHVDYSTERAGHDFWLTRNGHGAGFWDREELGENGNTLSERAGGYGDANLLVGDNGELYYC